MLNDLSIYSLSFKCILSEFMTVEVVAVMGIFLLLSYLVSNCQQH